MLAVVGSGAAGAGARATLARNALLQKTFGAGPLILSSIRNAIPMIPSYSQSLVSLIGPTELGTGFLWAYLIGLGVAGRSERGRARHAAAAA